MLNLKKCLTAILTNIAQVNSSLKSFQIRKVKYSYSIAAYASDHTNLYTLINNDMPSGYKYLAVSGFNTGNAAVTVTNIRYINTDYSLEIRNISSSAVSSTAEIYYLCLKN